MNILRESLFSVISLGLGHYPQHTQELYTWSADVSKWKLPTLFTFGFFSAFCGW